MNSDSAVTGRVFSPGCGLPGCQHHYSRRPGRCKCPAWFDGDGYHLISVSPSCDAHEAPAAATDPAMSQPGSRALPEAVEVRDLLARLEAADRHLTPEHVAQRFRELQAEGP